MSAPVNAEAQKKVKELIDKNLEAGDWKYDFLPNTFTIVPLNGVNVVEDLLSRVGKIRIPRE